MQTLGEGFTEAAELQFFHPLHPTDDYFNARMFTLCQQQFPEDEKSLFTCLSEFSEQRAEQRNRMMLMALVLGLGGGLLLGRIIWR